MFLSISNACYSADIIRIIYFIKELLKIIFFVVPIGLIVMLSVDLGKSVISGKEDEMKKNLNVFIKRIMFCVAMFFIPTIVSFSMKLVEKSGIMDAWNEETNWLVCYNIANKSTVDKLNEIEKETTAKYKNNENKSTDEIKKEIEESQEDYLKKLTK